MSYVVVDVERVAPITGNTKLFLGDVGGGGLFIRERNEAWHETVERERAVTGSTFRNLALTNSCRKTHRIST